MSSTYEMFRGNGLHRTVVEEVMGRPLPPGAEIHHVDGNPRNNANANLVVCQDSAYHKLLHKRARALKECGNANWRKCTHCKKYDDPANLVQYHFTCHRECHRLASKRYKERKNVA